MQKTGETLISWGITPNLLGYKYILDALGIFKADPITKYALHKKLYPRIAMKNETTSRGVGSALRNAVNKLPALQNLKELPPIISALVTTGELCTSSFLAALAEYVKEEKSND